MSEATVPTDSFNILVVVDPSQEKAPALERALYTGRSVREHFPQEQGELKILLAVDPENNDTSADNPAMLRNHAWLQKTVLEPVQSAGEKYSIGISWSTDWYGSILRAADMLPARLIILPLENKPRATGRLLNESIWRVIRTAKVPVLVVQPSPVQERKVILAAVALQSHKESHEALNDAVIARGKWLAEVYGAELHIVNAYDDSLNYPDRTELLQRSGVDSSRVHIQHGTPHEVLARVSKEIGADVLVLGTRNRATRWRGTTAERIITEVDCDVLMIR
ncbi:MAG: universal stress protein [Spongiibacteraceae bacterium]|jgi:universal stress protein E|nr:universal stress protein [Spongiibacteraceae bacterium]